MNENSATNLAATTSTGLELRSLSKILGSHLAVDDLSLEIGQGEFFTLLGPSGSGKTTTLNIVAGFLAPDQGSVLLSGRDVSRVPPEKRDIGIVFQSYALFPHMTVEQNVAYPMRRRGMRAREANGRARDILEVVELSDRAHYRPKDLSGGQQQRAALARALVFEPSLVLLDEPLGALDRRLRQHLQEQLRLLHSRIGFTALYITHDQEEALALSDRVGIMQDGRILQLGTGEDCYRRPHSLFTATFLGEANVFAARLIACHGSRGEVRLLGDGHRFDCAVAPGVRPGDEVALIARPEALTLDPQKSVTSPETLVRGRLVERVFVGQDVITAIACEQGRVHVRERYEGHRQHGQVGEMVSVCWRDPSGAVVVPTGKQPAAEPTIDDDNGVAVSELHR